MTQHLPKPASSDDRDAPEDRSEQAPSSRGASPAVAQVAPPPRESGVDLIKDAVARFLVSTKDDEGDAFIRGAVIDKLYPSADDRKKIDDALVDDLTQEAHLQAVEIRWPPWTKGGIPGWVKRLTHRTVFHYFRTKKREAKYIDPDVDPVDLRADRAFPKTDFGARAHFIAKHLERLIGDSPAKKQTLRLMFLRDEGYSIDELARENGTTPGALSLRIHKLRKELLPKIRVMDDEKKRLMILVVLWGGGALLILAVIAWLWAQPSAVPPAPLSPPPVPTASAAPAPTLDIARDTPGPKATEAADAAVPRPQPQPSPRPRQAPTTPDGGAVNDNGLDDSKGPPR